MIQQRLVITARTSTHNAIKPEELKGITLIIAFTVSGWPHLAPPGSATAAGALLHPGQPENLRLPSIRICPGCARHVTSLVLCGRWTVCTFFPQCVLIRASNSTLLFYSKFKPKSTTPDIFQKKPLWLIIFSISQEMKCTIFTLISVQYKYSYI